MGKKKHECSGCGRTEYLNIDKVRILKKLDMNMQESLIEDILNMQEKMVYPKITDEGIEIRSNLAQLFNEVTKKYGSDEVVSWCFYQVVKNITEQPLERIDSRLIKDSPANKEFHKLIGGEKD